MLTRKGYVEISSGVFMETKRIKLITERRTASDTFRKLVKETKANGTYVKLGHPKQTNNVYVLVDDFLYLTSFSYDELIQNCINSGINLIKVSPDACVPVTYIKAIYDLENEVVSWSVRNYSLPKAILQFVSQGEKRRTALILRSDEVIYLSKNAKEILESL